jgi:hypothetical protein
MIQTFPPGVRVLWLEPFHQERVPGVVVGPSAWPWAPLISVRLRGGLLVAARRDRLVRR